MSRISRPWWSLLWRRSILPFTTRSSGGAGLMSVHIDINCDMGESYGRWTLGADEEIMPNITSANIACGFHGGDPHVMRRSVELAVQHGVAVGAHPGLPDLMGFGRRRMDVSPQEIKDIHRYQVGALYGFAKAADQAVRMVMEGKVRTITGKVIDARIDTICIHGDSPGAEKIVAAVRDALVKAGATVKPLRDWFGR